jgi:hypothetical protein
LFLASRLLTVGPVTATSTCIIHNVVEMVFLTTLIVVVFVASLVHSGPRRVLQQPLVNHLRAYRRHNNRLPSKHVKAAAAAAVQRLVRMMER